MRQRFCGSAWRNGLIPVLAAVLSFAPSFSAALVPGSTGSLQQGSDAVKVGIEYAKDTNGAPLLLDVYSPEGVAGGSPAVILVHGGGFTGGERGGLRSLANRFVDQGWVVIVIDYRLNEVPGHPGEVEDVRAAVSWSRANAVNLGLDPDRMALYGTSAGGTLVSQAANMSTGPLNADDRVVAVVSVSGPMDLSALTDELGPEGRAVRQVEKYLGCSAQACPELYVAASPITYVSPDDPPHFLTQSTEEVIPMSQGQAMESALRSAGVPVQFELVPGDAHSSRLIMGTDGLLDEVFDFLHTQFDQSSPDAPEVVKVTDEVIVEEATSFMQYWLAIGGLVILAGVVVLSIMRRRSQAESR